MYKRQDTSGQADGAELKQGQVAVKGWVEMPHHGAGNPDDDRACKQSHWDAPQTEAKALAPHVSADLFFGGAQTAQQTKTLGPLQNTDVKAAGNHDGACDQYQQKQHQRNAVKGIGVRVAADAVEPEKPLVFLNLAGGQAIGCLLYTARCV